MNNKSILELLREATAGLHEKLEQQNPARSILDHSMDLDTYKQLLLHNYRAYWQIETELEAFLPFLKLDKAFRLEKDLEALGVAPDKGSAKLQIDSLPEAFGAAYVMEGSALGGLVIAKHLTRCQKLKPLEPQHFFSGDKTSLSSWKRFKEELMQQVFTEHEMTKLLAKAKETFMFFEEVYQQDQEQPLSENSPARLPAEFFNKGNQRAQ